MNGDPDIKPPGTPPAAPVVPDDADSQALAEALRSSFGLVRIVMILLVLVFLGSGFFTVGPQEMAIKLRLGKPVGEGEKALLGAGLHWSFPYPIDEVIKVPITEIQRLRSTVGWFATTPEDELAGREPPAGASLNPAIDGYVLTADGNIIHTRANLSYRINDPIRCVFGFAGDTNQMFGLSGISNVVQNALDNALIYAAARFTVFIGSTFGDDALAIELTLQFCYRATGEIAAIDVADRFGFGRIDHQLFVYGVIA